MDPNQCSNIWLVSQFGLIRGRRKKVERAVMVEATATKSCAKTEEERGFLRLMAEWDGSVFRPTLETAWRCWALIVADLSSNALAFASSAKVFRNTNVRSSILKIKTKRNEKTHNKHWSSRKTFSFLHYLAPLIRQINYHCLWSRPQFWICLHICFNFCF